jgi:hypothetical protein
MPFTHSPETLLHQAHRLAARSRPGSRDTAMLASLLREQFGLPAADAEHLLRMPGNGGTGVAGETDEGEKIKKAPPV